MLRTESGGTIVVLFSVSKLLRTVRLARFAKLLRLFRLFRFVSVLSRFEGAFFITYSAATLVKFVLVSVSNQPILHVLKL